MKLTKLHIESYKHLENISFDFTYPEGHEKAGQPLEKICIIGQSATGKTNVLELVKESLVELESISIVNGTHILEPYSLNFKGDISYLVDDSQLNIYEDKIVKGDSSFLNNNGSGGVISYLIDENLKLVYFGSDIISKEAINVFNQNPINLTEIDKLKVPDKKFVIHNYIYEFSQNVNDATWYVFLSKILDYRKKFTQMASELINKGTIGDFNKLNKHFSEWSIKNVNPLIEFSEYFNPILNKLNLEVDLVNTEYFIPIKSKLKDEVIPISGLSTGTKGLLLSMFPMFELDTTDAIILMDEPERSLFPDMQIDLIKHYQKIAPSAQFVIATHSPFIAAAFEPEERFILYFDEEGKVALRKGESPIGDDPNDLLRNDFKVDYYNEFGKQAYKQYLALKTKLSSETEPETKKKLLVELAELGDKYNF